ncbi:MAG: M28 family peptidase [Elusimicrobiota bacterium]
MFYFLIFSLFLNSKVFYDIKADINPQESFLNVNVELKFDRKLDKVDFYLNKDFNIDWKGFTIVYGKEEGIYRKYTAYYKNGRKFDRLSFNYSGIINYPIKSVSEEYQRSFRETEGIISLDGCYLTKQSYWYPVMEKKEAFGFSIKVSIEKDYKVVLAGKRIEEKIENDKNISLWKSSLKNLDIPLVCGKFIEYNKKDDIDLYVFLRNEDKTLADKYLDYALKYIKMYSSLIGKYPYEKFAVVENFWETGYAFPSFTLIGPTVIRFPFIFITSYPHEILHNWWGNGVFVDYKKGNWCEGLTAYMADYAIQEQKGKDLDYRISVIKKYNDSVLDNNDFPLSQFIERHSGLSESIGYGKALMFFHMLRKKLGDEVFIRSLRNFYRKNLFKEASWDDIRVEFEKEGKVDLKEAFDRYVNQKGLESISISSAELKETSTGYLLSFVLSQTGNFFMDIPVFLIYKDYSYEILNFDLKGFDSKKIDVFLSSRPRALGIDLMYDMPRKLNNRELPSTLSRVNGAMKVSFLLDDEYSGFLKPYQYKDYKILRKEDLDLSKINTDLWIVGKETGILNEVLKENDYNIRIDSSGIWIDNIKYEFDKNSFVFSFLNPENPDYTVNFFFPRDKISSELISFKIPHYSKYSYLVFDSENNNILSGVWKLKSSPNIFLFDEFDYSNLKLTSSPLVVNAEYSINKFKLKKDVYFLSKKLKTRHPGSNEIEKAANYIEKRLKKNHFLPFFGGSYKQEFEVDFNGKKYKTKNICGYLKGKSDLYIFLTAHYDHLFPKDNSFFPGANDNASGVSVLLGLSDLLSKVKSQKNNLAFCFFSGEEEQRSGSKYFLESLSKDIISKILANVNLDTIGKINKEIYILNSNSSSKWQSIIKNASLATMINYKISTLPLDSSDQMSFIEKQIPAIQIFDGGDPDYHTPKDVYENINFDGLLVAGDFVLSLIDEISKYPRLDFLDIKIQKPIKKRKISLGFMPDFGYSGKGVRIARLSENSLLLNTEIKEGDIITKLNDIEIDNLITYNNALSEIEGDVYIEYISGNQTKKVKIAVK